MSGPNPAAAEPTATGGKFLTFFLDEEEYGVEILKVSEILGLLPITPLPGAPSSVRGVVNLRGKVIPVLDLRLRLGMEAVEPTEATCIVVVQLGGRKIGLVVDRVSEVMAIRDEDVDEAPGLGTATESGYLLGIAKADGAVKLLLAMERVLAGVGWEGLVERAPAGSVAP